MDGGTTIVQFLANVVAEILATIICTLAWQYISSGRAKVAWHYIRTRLADLVEKIRENDYAFVLVNFANADMVGHTGVLDAAVKAVETIDSCVDRLSAAVLALGGQLLITADHGNCELMVDPETGEPHTAHTTNPVPIYWITPDATQRGLRDGGLADMLADPLLANLHGDPRWEPFLDKMGLPH